MAPGQSCCVYPSASRDKGCATGIASEGRCSVQSDPRILAADSPQKNGGWNKLSKNTS